MTLSPPLPSPAARGGPGHNLRLAIEYVAPSTLRADETNPRKHGRKQLTQIMRSMERFGNLVPLLATTDGRLICGHARLAAAIARKAGEVPVIRAEHMSVAEIRAFQIADNRLTETGEWDARLLGEAFKDLSLQALDFDLEITGFDMPRIDLLISGLDDGAAGNDADDAPAPRGPAITQLGDLWEVGGHRVLCGDARGAASYLALMAGETAAMVFSDPPYNVKVQGFVGGRGKIKHAEFKMASGEMTEVEYALFLGEVYQRAGEVAAPGALAYWCIDWRHLHEALVAGRQAYAGLRNLCVWAKTQPGQGSFYRSQHELVLMFEVGGGKPRNNIQLGRFGRNRSNLWTYASPAHLGGEDGRRPLEDHPTPKPVQLIADAILDCTARGDIVLDPFLGGGASLAAAERTGRRCRGVEIEPAYVDAALRRLRLLTGEDAVRLSDGRAFADLEVEANDGGSDDDESAVGYGKPPPGRRFAKGVSGNPAGRPRKLTSIGLDTHDALHETVEIKENGVKRKITKQRAAAKQLANRGASGDLQAIKLISALARHDAASAPVEVTLTVDEGEIAERLIARIRHGWRRIDDGAA